MIAMKTSEKNLHYWEALPIPRKWRVGEDHDGKGNEREKRLVKSVWDEWTSAHPMDGG